jgi:hypothetical protein
MNAAVAGGRNMITSRVRASWLLAAALVLVACGGDDDNDPPPVAPSLPNVLRIGSAEGAAGDTVTVSFLLENTVVLSGLQFDLVSNPSRLTVTGAAAGPRAAGFDASFNADAGIARVVLLDLDDTARIAAGDGVVATVTVAVAAGAPAGTTALRVENATAVNAAATTVPIGSSEARFTVR